jgi:transcriptional regulator with XRE-family HTH domain
VQIGKRLRALRKEKRLSQGDIEDYTGMMCCYISSVENGRHTPSVRTLERWAQALGVNLYEIFLDGDGTLQPAPLKVIEREPTDPFEKSLIQALKRMNEADRRLFLSLLRHRINQHKPASTN